MSTALALEALYAIGIGLLVGLEREHHDLEDHREPGSGVERREVALGARTFALLGLLGWLLGLGNADAPWLLPVGIAAVVAMVLTERARRLDDLGLTTEVAAVLITLLGALVHHDRSLAVAMGVAVALLLVSKTWMRSMVIGMRRVEITATIQLLILVAIVLPLLPAEPVDPWGILPPRKVGMFIVAIAGIQYVGYVATRILGTERGVGLAGLVGGLTSSTAVTISMARAARENPGMEAPGRLAVLLANIVLPVRVAVISTVLSAEVGARVAIPLGAMAVLLLFAAVWQRREVRRAATKGTGQPIELSNPLSLWAALSWGAILCAILIVSHVANQWLGSSGLVLTALASGLADVDAITFSAAQGAQRGGLAVEIAALAILAAVASNTAVKATMAYVAGGREFGKVIVLALGAALLASAVTTVIAFTFF